MNPANTVSQLSPGMAECHACLMAVAKHGTPEAFSATLAGVLQRAELSISNAYDAGANASQEGIAQAGRASLSLPAAWQEPVAYLDLGAGGYIDMGTDLSDEALAALPKGRHMLVIAGTYGVDGYKPAAPQPAVAAGLLNAEDMAALQRADECFDDGEGSDLRKDQLNRLLEIGVMRHNGGGYYSITSFGRLILGDTHMRPPLETVDECNDRLGREHKQRLAAHPPCSIY